MISEDNVRVAVTLSKDSKKKAEKIAKREKRTLSNFIANLIELRIKQEDDTE